MLPFLCVCPEAARKGNLLMKRTGRGQRTCVVATNNNGDIAGQHHAQQRELLGSMYNEAPQAVWQSAATRALEVNALLMAAVVGEQQRAAQGRGNDKDEEAAKKEESSGGGDDDDDDDTQGDDDDSSDCDNGDSSRGSRGDDEDDDGDDE
jgi:hypothetical protein